MVIDDLQKQSRDILEKQYDPAWAIVNAKTLDELQVLVTKRVASGRLNYNDTSRQRELLNMLLDNHYGGTRANAPVAASSPAQRLDTLSTNNPNYRPLSTADTSDKEPGPSPLANSNPTTGVTETTEKISQSSYKRFLGRLPVLGRGNGR